MNKILSLFYRFRPIRLWWWRRKRQFNQNLNNRERLQEAVDFGIQRITLPSGTISMDHTIYLGEGTRLVGAGRDSSFIEKGEKRMSVKFTFEEYLEGIKTGKIWGKIPNGRYVVVTCPKCLDVEFRVVPKE